MTEVKYNTAKINELKANKYVKNCTGKHVVFTKIFKFEAVKLHKTMIPKEIFKNFWFPKYVINSEIPKNSIARWEKNINEKWVIEEKKWRIKKEEKLDLSKMTLKEQNEYLKAENLYLKEFHNKIYWNYP